MWRRLPRCLLVFLGACTSGVPSVGTYPGTADDSGEDTGVCPDESEITPTSDYVPQEWGISIADAAQAILGDFTGTAEFMGQAYPARLISQTEFADLSIQTLSFDIDEDGSLECQHIVKMDSSFSLQIDGLVSVASDGYPRLGLLQQSSGAILSEVEDSVPYHDFQGSDAYSPESGYHTVAFNNDPTVTDFDLIHLRVAYEDLSVMLCRGEEGCP